MLYPLRSISFKTINHENAYDVLSGKVVAFDHRLLFDIVSILSSMEKGKISEERFFSKYLVVKGIAWSDFQAALKELKFYQDRGVFQRDTHTYQREARHLESSLRMIKRAYFKNQQKSSLILNITHMCNLRCRYCHFTGLAYGGSRRHSKKNMSLELAQKSIRNYLIHTKDQKSQIYIQFYGGEPLLDFNKICFLIEYAKEEKKRLKHKASKMNFHVATNGTLLTEGIIKFFIKNRIWMQVSIDGPRAIHDKNRIDVNGRGSFTRALKNLKKLKQLSLMKHRSQYFNRYVTVNATNFYQTPEEIDSVRRFFSQSVIFKELFTAGKILFEVAGTNALKGKYRKRQTAIDTREAQESLEALGALKSRVELEKIRIKRNLKIFYSFKGAEQRKKAFRNLIDIIKNHKDVLFPAPGKEWDIRAMTGTCFPGYKQFIDLDGKIYICTQASFNKTTMIGQGALDFKKIEKILRAHVLKYGHLCRVCPVFPFCKECVVHSADDNGFLKFKRNSLNCANHKRTISKKFSFIYSLIEELPEFERFIRKEFHKNKYKN